MDEELEARIIEVVTSKGMAQAGNCPWCGYADWGILSLTRLYQLEVKHTIPTVSLTCIQCGNILTFELKRLGFEDLEELRGGP